MAVPLPLKQLSYLTVKTGDCRILAQGRLLLKIEFEPMPQQNSPI